MGHPNPLLQVVSLDTRPISFSHNGRNSLTRFMHLLSNAVQDESAPYLLAYHCSMLISSVLVASELSAARPTSSQLVPVDDTTLNSRRRDRPNTYLCTQFRPDTKIRTQDKIPLVSTPSLCCCILRVPDRHLGQPGHSRLEPGITFLLQR